MYTYVYLSIRLSIYRQIVHIDINIGIHIDIHIDILKDRHIDTPSCLTVEMIEDIATQNPEIYTTQKQHICILL